MERVQVENLSKMIRVEYVLKLKTLKKWLGWSMFLSWKPWKNDQGVYVP